jgi:probable DNA repair protein
LARIDNLPQSMTGNALVLCSTARLARSLRMELGHIQRARGMTQWQPPTILTLAQWLDDAITRAMLAGELPADYLPRQILDSMAERLLWERAIEKNTQDDAVQALFDMAGLAQTAAEANRLLIEWNIHLAGGEQTEETRQFLRWRETFQTLCRQHQTLEAARYLDRQIDGLQRGAGALPIELHLAGFDRFSPQEKRLLEVLAARGVQVLRWPLGLDQPASAVQIACDDVDAECRAAVAWAARRLAQEPHARLAIVAPELGALRARLAAMLDDALHPASIHPSRAAMPRCYDFSLGDPLSAHPMIACALSLLRLSVRRYRISQQDAGHLLRDIYWSAGISEADARARLEARMRGRLSPRLQLEQLLRLARKAQLDGLGVARLVGNLEAISAATAGWPRKQSARAWAAAFAGLLKAAAWPGERSLSSHEFQARQAWEAALNDFGMLDALLGPLDAGAALHRLSRLAQERIFQPEAEGEPRLLVMGMLEAAAAPLDAMWVLGMNDHQWPPPPRPNPLLPAETQRRAHAPNACSSVQTEFAQAIHARLMHGAAEIVFSWSHRDGERELRPSPVISAIPLQAAAPELAATLAERLAQPAEMQWLDDHMAPPVAAGEIQRGGTGLLKAQAICPAWAYYQYRLGARALDEPVEGLDALARGNLLHMVLQAFWTGRTSVDLHGMDDTALESSIAAAVEAGVRQFIEQSDAPLPPQFAALEKLRLQRILAAWLELEKTREPFSVQECEQRISLDIDGLQVNLVLDRIDELPDGRLVVLDYKTGASVSHKSWAEDRIAEPQLPIYAALALRDGEVAAVCFAKVQAAEQKFIGIAEEDGVLPGVNSLDGARKLFPEDCFPDWAALIRHWQVSIAAIATEIKAGEAAVKFRNEEDMRDCDVKPLLRLPERKLQLERQNREV